MDLLTMTFNIIIISIIWALMWYERELKNQPAWIRTHMLIWIWSTLFMTISIMLPEIYGSEINDPWRIAAQVVSWVWFIWAWAIMKVWLSTKGLTTAANIWAISAIWLAVWAGMYEIAIISTVIILSILVFITRVKPRFIKSKKYFNISFYTKNKIKDKELAKVIKKLKLTTINKSIENIEENTKMRYFTYSYENVDSSKINKELKNIKSIDKIVVEQL